MAMEEVPHTSMEPPEAVVVEAPERNAIGRGGFSMREDEGVGGARGESRRGRGRGGK